VTQKSFVLLCLSAGLLGGCATPDAQKFIDQYRLQPSVGPLYEVVRQEQVVGWLYGSVHYGTVEQPSMSQAAVRKMAGTRHIYLEHTDGPGSSWEMRDAVAPSPEDVAQAKKKAATASLKDIWQGIAAANELRKGSTGVLALDRNRCYQQTFALVWNYCGAFYEYGTERLAFVFAAGKDMAIHALEPDSRITAPGPTAAVECKAPNGSPVEPDEEGMRQELDRRTCRNILAQLLADQSNRPTPVDLKEADFRTLEQRNRTMAAKTLHAIRTGETPFVIVGRAHLTYGKNLIQLLEEQGFALRRID
jgi:hypothetical protein